MTSRPHRSHRHCAIDASGAAVDHRVITARGGLDAACVDELADAIDAVHSSADLAIIEADDVTIFSAAAVGVLAQVSFDPSRGDVLIRNPSPVVRLVLEVSGLAGLIESA